MNCWTRWFALTLLAVATTAWLTGCGKDSTSKPDKPKPEDSKKEGDHKDHKDGDHKDKDGHGHKDGGHDDKPLTEKDIKMPDSFKAGATRQEELHKQIGHQIEHGELPKVHRSAEEMALVAKKMKELAQKDVAEDKRAEAGRLCNELAGYYKPIDEAADAGKKAETEAVHKKMADTIKKLKDLAG